MHVDAGCVTNATTELMYALVASSTGHIFEHAGHRRRQSCDTDGVIPIYVHMTLNRHESKGTNAAYITYGRKLTFGSRRALENHLEQHATIIEAYLQYPSVRQRRLK